MRLLGRAGLAHTVASEPLPPPHRAILHVDMDAFYAAVEQLDHPEWRGLPVVVGADPKAGKGRGVVATASYEARRFGIHSAMPISQAWRACPDAVYVYPRMWRYRDMARTVRKVLTDFAGDRVEPVSIDEAYLDVTHALTEGRFVDGGGVGAALKAAVRDATGLTCSVGVAPSKSVAKIASDLHKPDGLTVVSAEEVVAFLAPLPVRRISGVGPKTAQWLGELGIETIGDLAGQSEAWVETHFGRNGLWAWHIARGHDDRPVEADHGLAKSRSEEHTFERDAADPTAINRVVRGMAASLVGDMRRHGILFRIVGLKIRSSEFQTWTRATTLRAPTQRLHPVLVALRQQLAEFVDGHRRFRLVGVRLAGLERDVGQKTLEEYLAGEEGTGVPLSQFPAWSVPESVVPPPGQQRLEGGRAHP